MLPPRPSGILYPQTSRAARWLAYGVAFANRCLDRLPPARAFYARQLRRHLEIHEFSLRVVREDVRPLEPFQIAFLSDLHSGSYLRQGDFEWLFDAVSERRPDLAVLGGDLINTRPGELDAVLAALPRLRARCGVVATPGNHELFWGLPTAEYESRLAGAGVRVLVNEGARFASSAGTVWVAGVDEWGEGEPDLDQALVGRRVGEPTVLISHHPDFFPAAVAAGVDLQLSGHTHGGQVAIRGWSPIRHTALGYMRGTYRCGHSVLHVGRGIGATILPVRLGARPELPIVAIGS